MKLKKGDNVKILSGKDRGKTGVVLKAYPEDDRITIDGTIYFHGATYKFGPAKAAVIKEVMGRQWLHHAEIKGLDMNEYLGRKPSNAVVQH